MIKSTTLRTTRLAGIRVGNSQVRRTSFSLLQALSALTLFRTLATVFSGVMDERITPRQAVCITQAHQRLPEEDQGHGSWRLQRCILRGWCS